MDGGLGGGFEDHEIGRRGHGRRLQHGRLGAQPGLAKLQETYERLTEGPTETPTTTTTTKVKSGLVMDKPSLTVEQETQARQRIAEQARALGVEPVRCSCRSAHGHERRAD